MKGRILLRDPSKKINTEKSTESGRTKNVWINDYVAHKTLLGIEWSKKKRHKNRVE